MPASHWRGTLPWQSPLIQVVILSRKTLLDTSERLFGLGTSWPIMVTHKINPHRISLVPQLFKLLNHPFIWGQLQNYYEDHPESTCKLYMVSLILHAWYQRGTFVTIIESILAYYFSQSCILYSDSLSFLHSKILPGHHIEFSCHGNLSSSGCVSFLDFPCLYHLGIWGWLGGVFHKMSARIWEMFFLWLHRGYGIWEGWPQS